MTNESPLTQITDLRGNKAIAHELITRWLTEMIGDAEITLDFYREWSGGWRADATVRGTVNGNMDFILFAMSNGGILALPIPMPERWRAHGIAASDGSIWSYDEQEMPILLVPAPPSPEDSPS